MCVCVCVCVCMDDFNQKNDDIWGESMVCIYEEKVVAVLD